jgi:hypothetical protein
MAWHKASKSDAVTLPEAARSVHPPQGLRNRRGSGQFHAAHAALEPGAMRAPVVETSIIKVTEQCHSKGNRELF